MTVSADSVRHTPLWDRHLALNATMADFGGWSMPMEYTGTVAEHRAVRESVGMFDVSHMGTVLIFGSGALEAVNAVLTNDLERISDGQAQYTMLCAENGGVIDDLIAYRFDENNLMLIPNATNSDAVVAELKRALTDTEVNVLKNKRWDDFKQRRLDGYKKYVAVIKKIKCMKTFILHIRIKRIMK